MIRTREELISVTKECLGIVQVRRAGLGACCVVDSDDAAVDSPEVSSTVPSE